MKAAVVDKPGSLKIVDVPDVKIEDCQALVRTLACSICNGTDRKIVHGTIPFFGAEGYPGILGHESVGRVVKIGAKVTSFNEGDLVFRPQADVEGYNCCWGGFAEFGTVTDLKAIEASGAGTAAPPHHTGQQVIPGEANVLEATVCITLKEVLSYLRALDVKPGNSLLVLGYGPVGLACAYMAKIIGMHPVIVAGRREEALRTARSFGADEVINTNTESIAEKTRAILEGNVDVVIDAIGKASIVKDAIAALHPEGKIGLYAVVDRGDAHLNHDDDKRIVSVGPDEAKAHDEIMRLWSSGKIHPDRFLTNVLPLDDIIAGFALIEQREAIKVAMNIAG
ncbi:MAG: zinc-binding dehydrogenase [Planctomycetes bacterium]|nr:zinc-binding dehydrogenase [Planctomycetota bacterium]